MTAVNRGQKHGVGSKLDALVRIRKLPVMKKSFTSIALSSIGLVASLLSSTPNPAFAQVVGTPILPGPVPIPIRPIPIEIISPPNHAVFFAPVNIPILAYASPFGLERSNVLSSNLVYGVITNVEFFAGTNDLGPGHRLGILPPIPVGVTPEPLPPITVLAGLWSLVWSNAPLGQYPLTAVATDTLGKSATSAPVNVTILLPPPPPTNRPPVVSIVATKPVAIEGTNCWVWPGLASATPSWTNWPPPIAVCKFFTNCGPQDAIFTVRRFGDTNGDVTVTYAIGGTASNGVDYMTLPGVVTIPAGQRSAEIDVIPIDNGPPDINKTVILGLDASTNVPPDYLLGFPRRAAAIILDSGKPFPVTGVLPDECFHLATTGPDGAWFSVQYSTDMLNWLPVCTNQVVNGCIDFVDPDAQGSASRFYRALPGTTPTD
jgi:hypothetical protein